jgi:hypothetical protein
MNAMNCTIHVHVLAPDNPVQPPPINTTRQFASLFPALASDVARGEQHLHLPVETPAGKLSIDRGKQWLRAVALMHQSRHTNHQPQMCAPFASW